MAERTIRSGIGTYLRPDGVWTHGMFGDVVDVHEDDVERFDRLNPEAPAEPEVDEIVADDPNGEPVEIVGTPVEPGAPTAPGAVVVPAGTEGVEIPEGAPEKAWTHAQIDAWAARQKPPILLEADASKDAKLEAIAKLQAAPQS
jgi:hypothetical protein